MTPIVKYLRLGSNWRHLRLVSLLVLCCGFFVSSHAQNASPQIEPEGINIHELSKNYDKYIGRTVRLKNISIRRFRDSREVVWIFESPTVRISDTCLYFGSEANLPEELVREKNAAKLVSLKSNETGHVTITVFVDTYSSLQKRPKKFKFSGGVPAPMDSCWRHPTPPFWLDLLKTEDFFKTVDPIVPALEAVPPKTPILVR